MLHGNSCYYLKTIVLCIATILNEKCIKSFHIDKFHLKPKNIKNLEHFTKVSKNTGTIPLYRCINKSR